MFLSQKEKSEHSVQFPSKKVDIEEIFQKGMRHRELKAKKILLEYFFEKLKKKVFVVQPLSGKLDIFLSLLTKNDASGHLQDLKSPTFTKFVHDLRLSSTPKKLKSFPKEK